MIYQNKKIAAGLIKSYGFFYNILLFTTDFLPFQEMFRPQIFLPTIFYFA